MVETLREQVHALEEVLFFGCVAFAEASAQERNAVLRDSASAQHSLNRVEVRANRRAIVFSELAVCRTS